MAEKPKMEMMLLVALLPNQRLKAGTSRVALKRTMVEGYKLPNNKRTVTRVNTGLKKHIEDGNVEAVTVQSFKLTQQGLELAKKYRASPTWKDFMDFLSGKPKRGAKKTTTKNATVEKKSGKISYDAVIIKKVDVKAQSKSRAERIKEREKKKGALPTKKGKKASRATTPKSAKRSPK